MENIYLFTKGNFIVKSDKEKYPLNKNSYLKISEFINDGFVDVCNLYSPNSERRLYLNLLENSNYFKMLTNNDSKFIEIISTDFSNLICKLKHELIEAYVYDYAIRLIYQNQCFCCIYTKGTKNHLLCDDKKILIFNENILLEFDKTNLIFNILNIEKFEKKDKKIQILCKIPHNFNYFLFFDIDLEKNKYHIEKYKKQTLTGQQIIESFFYLAKFGFEDAKSYLYNSEIFQDCCRYFSCFESLHNFENQFYATKHDTITKISFSIKDNKIIDID